MHEHMGFLSCVSILFLVMDPLGNLPVIAGLLKGIPPGRVRRIMVREHLFALALLFFFLLFGQFFLNLLGIQDPALGISGGIVLFLISVRMIFPAQGEGMFGELPSGEPFIVPLATPLIVGPSAMTTVLILASKSDVGFWRLAPAMVAAWAGSLAILFNAAAISRLLGERGVTAIQRLMGMILTTIAVQMLLTGLAQFFGKA
ncbi:MAG: MarC family protein [Elusimicrobia bacterium]|nr:MarC family protein [Elusimicrobiota bacterium]